MEPNFYTETATVLNADADFRSLLKPSALLRYVEQVSADHAPSTAAGVPSSASLRSRMPPGSWWPRWTAAGSWWT